MVTKPKKIGGFSIRFRNLMIQFPLLRGMLSYALIWPSSSLVQQYIEKGSIEDLNIARAAGFGIFGTFFMAPVFHGWLKFSNRYFKKKSFRMAVTRAAVEQVCYCPFAVAYFFFGMSVIEFKPLRVCVNEVREKFWPTYKSGMMFWPVAQTLNFYFVPERNRMVFVSACSFIWTVYLAHVKARDNALEPKSERTKPVQTSF